MRKVIILTAALLMLLLAVLPASAQTAPAFVIHTVTAADANGGLSKIARQYCTDWQTIYALNEKTIGPNPNIIRAGQQLVVPNNCVNPLPPTTGVVDTGPRAFANGFVVGTNVYIPAAGDTLTSIAIRFNTTTQSIMTANNMTNPNLVIAGQPLIIPGLNGSSFPSQPTPTPVPPTTGVTPQMLPPGCILTLWTDTLVYASVGGPPVGVIPPGQYTSTLAFTAFGSIWYQLSVGQLISTGTSSFSATPACTVVS